MAREMALSLFCGLPRIEKRMALVFQAVSDESGHGSGTGLFHYGGFVAPVLEWTDKVTPAWEAKVLNPSPQIPYMHMTEIRSREWRRTRGNGITEYQADCRIDAAVEIVAGNPSLKVAIASLDAGKFRELFKGSRIRRLPDKQPGSHPMMPDHLGFLGFVRSALQYVKNHYPDASKVDFLYERSSASAGFETYIENMDDHLSVIGGGNLVPLLGEFIPGGKERVPLQVVDLALWHLRRGKEKKMDRADRRRLFKMFSTRDFIAVDVPNEVLEQIRRNLPTVSAALDAEDALRRKLGS